ncbi:MAG: hypothetical protein WAU00_24100 [Caldilinea sp.]
MTANPSQLPSSAAPAARPASSPPRRDRAVLWGGILFSAAFTLLIWMLGPRLAAFPHLPDQGATWYYWKLPAPETWARVTAWGFYLMHNAAIWAILVLAQRHRTQYGTSLSKYNIAALAVNALFVLLHLVQTHVWYDGLAQDVHIFTSQWSVILMLVLIVMMENPRRGMFFGRKAPLPQRTVQFLRKYHGYIFSWAVIYTFWYHPMETTSGHLIGFLYTFLLLLQGSLFFTRVHLNKWWGFALETMVLVHGTLVAIIASNGLWQMFFFGFAGIVVATTMHGLGLPRWVRLSILGAYIAFALFVYNQIGLAKIHQITWIPLTYYAVVLALALLIGLGLWLVQKIGARFRPTSALPDA